MSGFIPITDYQGAAIRASHIGRYEGFSVCVSYGHGYKRHVLHARLRGIRIRVIRWRGTAKPFRKKPQWCFA